MKSILLFVLILAAQIVVIAKPFESPEAYIREFNKTIGGTAADFVQSWYSEPPLSKEIDSNRAKSTFDHLKKLEEDYGRILEVKVLERRIVADSTAIFYLATVYEQGSIFYFVKLSENGSGWIITEYLVNANPEKVLPLRLLKEK